MWHSLFRVLLRSVNLSFTYMKTNAILVSLGLFVFVVQNLKIFFKKNEEAERGGLNAVRRAWTGTAGWGVLATALAWLLVVSWYSMKTVYDNHEFLVSENKALRQQLKAVEAPPPNKTQPVSMTGASGNRATGSKGAGVVGGMIQGPGSIAQLGGSGNTATVNNGPPPLKLTPSLRVVASDREGMVKTEITVVPNLAVSAPFSIALDFDNPINSIGWNIQGVGALLGGGNFRLGTHALTTVGTGIGPQHPLIVTVYSNLPVELVKEPNLE